MIEGLYWVYHVLDYKYPPVMLDPGVQYMIHPTQAPQYKEYKLTIKPLQDLRNHGESPHSKRHDYVAMAEDVEHFLEARNLGPKTTLIGHSMSVFPPKKTLTHKPTIGHF